MRELGRKHGSYFLYYGHNFIKVIRIKSYKVYNNHIIYYTSCPSRRCPGISHLCYFR